VFLNLPASVSVTEGQSLDSLVYQVRADNHFTWTATLPPALHYRLITVNCPSNWFNIDTNTGKFRPHFCIYICIYLFIQNLFHYVSYTSGGAYYLYPIIVNLLLTQLFTDRLTDSIISNRLSMHIMQFVCGCTRHIVWPVWLCGKTFA